MTTKFIKIDIPAGYEFRGVDDKYVIFGMDSYPETCEECSDILNTCTTSLSRVGYKGDLMGNFQRLLICRDAYWKLAEGWDPNWEEDDDKYCIGISGDTIQTYKTKHAHKLLAFPTEEMCDAFKDNFSELIDKCRELI